VQEPLAATNKKKRLPAAPAAAPAATGTETPDRPPAPAAKREKSEKPAAGGGEVVRLDRFRKK
jgi:hypothetical protein